MNEKPIKEAPSEEEKKTLSDDSLQQVAGGAAAGPSDPAAIQVEPYTIWEILPDVNGEQPNEQ